MKYARRAGNRHLLARVIVLSGLDDHFLLNGSDEDFPMAFRSRMGRTLNDVHN